MDIYSRVRELVEDKKEKLTMEQIFTSSEYARFIWNKTVNIISGAFYSLRRHGFNVSQSEENKLLQSLEIEIFCDPKNGLTACAGVDKLHRKTMIRLNAGCGFVTYQETRAGQHAALLGLLYHEVGHLLFSDYPSLAAWQQQLRKGVWFPNSPQRITTGDGVLLGKNMEDGGFCNVLSYLAGEVNNCIEDGYIEREIGEMCPGNGRAYIATMNLELIENALTIEEDIAAKKEDFDILLNQILYYAEFGQCFYGDYDGALIPVLEEAIEIIDDVGFQRSPFKRIEGVNELLCLLAPYLNDAIQKEQKRQESQKDQGQQNGQGAPGGSGQAGQGNSSPNGNGSGSQSGQGNQAQSGVSDAVMDALRNRIGQIAQSVNGESDHSNMDTRAYNNPTKSQNMNGESQQPGGKSDGQDPAGAPSGSSSRGSMAANAIHGAAEQSLSNIINQIAEAAANRQAEAERTQELNQEGKDISLSDYGLDSNISVSVSRAEDVSGENIKVYEGLENDVIGASRDLQRDIRRVLKDRRAGGKLKNLPFGRRLEVTSVIHGDGKYFSKTKLPTEKPRLGVGLLVDESGSTKGPLIAAAMRTSLVIEDFCRSLDIPHLIYGYTTGNYQNSASIISYAEPHEIDGGNRYRITGMAGRGGTPTASAMAYMLKRMQTLPADIRLLIVVTDGQSGDNRMLSDGEHLLSNIVREARRRNYIVCAAGIGRNKESVEKEFGDCFIDISDLEQMSDELIGVIKSNLWV